MDSKDPVVLEQRAVIKFLCKRDTSNKNILKILEHHFGEKAYEKAALHLWIQKFKSVRDEIKDEARSPCKLVNQENHS